jgi:hypothetical protein
MIRFIPKRIAPDPIIPVEIESKARAQAMRTAGIMQKAMI